MKKRKKKKIKQLTFSLAAWKPNWIDPLLLSLPWAVGMRPLLLALVIAWVGLEPRQPRLPSLPGR
jgi:hypothetical protein